MNKAPTQTTRRINLTDPQIKLFQLASGQSFTIPESIDIPPMPNNLMAAATSRRATGGEIFGFTDDQGVIEPHRDFGLVLKPGDRLVHGAIGAVAANTSILYVNDVEVLRITCSDISVVLGFYS